MKFRVLFLASVVSLLAVNAYAQHQHAGDIEFGYDNLATPTELEVEAVELTTEGIMIFESEFEELDPLAPGDFSADEPGFTTNDGEGLLVNPGDAIFLNFLDASAHSSVGVGYVNYYNPGTNMLEELFGLNQIAVLDNSAGTADLILGSSISGDNPQFLGLGDGDGDVHDHVVFDLLNDASMPLGAYGLLLEMQSDFAVLDGNMDLTSDKFWIVFNHGMDEEDFENLAIPAFGTSAVPEPGAATVLLFATSMVAFRRRRI